MERLVMNKVRSSPNGLLTWIINSRSINTDLIKKKAKIKHRKFNREKNPKKHGQFFKFTFEFEFQC